MGRLRKSSHTGREFDGGRHRFEHWYRDNSVYFITARVRDGVGMFERREAREVFWDRFGHYTSAHGFFPWATTLIYNHYHTIGYQRVGSEVGEMMRKIHGSVAMGAMKVTGVRHVPFWREGGHRDYFDGCIRDVLQAERAYRYVLNQAVRARLVRDWREYPDTRVGVEMGRGIRRAAELGAFLEGVPYARHEKRRRGSAS